MHFNREGGLTTSTGKNVGGNGILYCVSGACSSEPNFCISKPVGEPCDYNRDDVADDGCCDGNGACSNGLLPSVCPLTCSSDKCEVESGPAAACQKWACNVAGECVSISDDSTDPCEDGDNNECTYGQCSNGQCMTLNEVGTPCTGNIFSGPGICQSGECIENGSGTSCPDVCDPHEFASVDGSTIASNGALVDVQCDAPLPAPFRLIATDCEGGTQTATTTSIRLKSPIILLMTSNQCFLLPKA